MRKKDITAMAYLLAYRRPSRDNKQAMILWCGLVQDMRDYFLRDSKDFDVLGFTEICYHQ